MSPRSVFRGGGRWLALVIALVAAAACQARGSDSERIAALMAQAKRLAGATCSVTELNQAAALYGEGFGILRSSRDVAAGLRCRFLLDAAECWARRGAYDRAAQALRAAAKAKWAWDAAEAARRLKQLEPLAKRWEEAQGLRNAPKRSEAIVAFERIAREYPAAAAAALCQQAVLHVALHQLAEAERILRDVATTYKGAYHGELALGDLGSVYQEQGKYDKALAAYRESIETYGDVKDRGLVHFWIGVLRAEMGQKHEALKELAVARKAQAQLPERGGRMLEGRIAEAEAKAKALKGN